MPQFVFKTLILFFAVSSSIALAQRDWQAYNIPNFIKVSDSLYRGGHPGPEGLEYLSKIGVKTVINLEGDDDDIREENYYAPKFGMKAVSIPLSGFWAPSDQDVDLVLATIAKTQNQPVFIHCHFGNDRTGLMVGLYRVFYQGWTPERAYEEMLDSGFHRSLIFLKNYFEKRTGYDSYLN